VIITLLIFILCYILSINCLFVLLYHLIINLYILIGIVKHCSSYACTRAMDLI